MEIQFQAFRGFRTFENLELGLLGILIQGFWGFRSRASGDSRLGLLEFRFRTPGDDDPALRASVHSCRKSERRPTVPPWSREDLPASISGLR